MVSEFSEFVDAYSDDQIYLNVLERLMNGHPSEGHVPDRIRYSSFCRLWAVMMVGAVECVVKEWTVEKPTLCDIRAYFDNGSNAERLERLKRAFRLRGLQVDVDAFEDFLAVKYIRNAYVHGEWNEKQRLYVTARGFPSSLMFFSKAHFDRMKASYGHVLDRLGMANAMNTFLEQRFQAGGEN